MAPWSAKLWSPGADIVFSYLASKNPPEDLVSICLTNFNYAEYLPNCLGSLAAQTHPALDLVIVDDCSDTDNSIGVATAWLKRNARRFHHAWLLRLRRNQGPSEARNIAFQHALSDYVFVIDADNEAFPRAVARLYAAIRAGGLAAVYPQLELFGDRHCIGDADIWDPVEMRRNNYVDVTGIVLKSAWREVGGYSHIDEGWEDYDFWLKFIDAGLVPGYVPEILCRYRVHARSRTATEAHVAHEKLKLIMEFRHPGRAEMPGGDFVGARPPAVLSVAAGEPVAGPAGFVAPAAAQALVLGPSEPAAARPRPVRRKAAP